jgi:hypothetical protein
VTSLSICLAKRAVRKECCCSESIENPLQGGALSVSNACTESVSALSSSKPSRPTACCTVLTRRAAPKYAEFTSCSTLSDIAGSRSTIAEISASEVSDFSAAMVSSQYMLGAEGKRSMPPTIVRICASASRLCS